MAKLARGLVPLFEMLRTKRAGDLVSPHEIMVATGWLPSTLATYRKKNKLAALLAETPDGEYRVLIDGAALRKEDVAGALTQKTERPMPLSKSERLTGEHDEYVLVRWRGDGAVGQVWEARAARSGAMVALKICSPRPDLLEPTVLANVRERFRREHKLGRRISHPNLVAYRDAGEFRGAPFLVMELAAETLRDVLVAKRALSLRESIEIVSDVVNALGALHAHSCVHRDVKPANVLRMERGYVLGDFGIVQWGDMSKAFTGAGTITKSAVQLGSWYYMSPEQTESPHAATPASDIYALGVSWIEMLAGEAPAPVRVAAGRIGAPSGDPNVDSLIKRMTSYDPDARPSVHDVAAAVAVLRAQVHRVSG